MARQGRPRRRRLFPTSLYGDKKGWSRRQKIGTLAFDRLWRFRGLIRCPCLPCRSTWMSWAVLWFWPGPKPSRCSGQTSTRTLW